MAKLATCPGCTTQLALPEDATLSDRARCPRCHEEFLLMETVQFSIPTAEILPPAAEAFAPSDTLSPLGKSPDTTVELDDSNSGEPEYAGEIQNSDDESPSLTESYPAPEPTPLGVSATLSDWEARLKRAIAADVDGEDNPEAPLQAEPSPDFSNLNPPATSSAEQVTDHTKDFAVSDADLIPEIEAAEISESEDQSAEQYYSDDEEATVKFASDQTISLSAAHGPHADDPEPLPQIDDTVVVRSRVTPGKKSRSPLRTLASASLGVVGIPIGLYVLLWLRGPAGDMLDIAQYLPSFMLPAEFNEFDSGAGERFAQEPSVTSNNNSSDFVVTENAQVELPPSMERPIVRDSAVSPASAEQLAYDGPTFALVDAPEFNELLSAAQQMTSLLTHGDLNSKDSVASKGQAYMALARLAEKCAFLNQPGRTPEGITSSQAAVQLFHTVLSDEIVQRDLPQIALRWWQYAERPSPGFVLIGKVSRLEPHPAGTIAFVAPEGDTTTPAIPVLLGNAEPIEGEYIAIVGVIEANPQHQLPALESSLGPLAIAHYSFPLDDADE